MPVNKKLKFLGEIAIVAALAACASSPEPVAKAEPAARKAVETYRPIHKQLTETDTLGSDQLNARYEEKTAAPDTDTVVRKKTEIKKLDKEKEFEKILSDAQRNKETKENKNLLKTAEKQNVKTTDKKEKKRKIPIVRSEPSVAYQAATFLFADGSANIAAEYNGEIRQIARLAKEKNAHITVYGFASSRTRDMDVAAHKLANFKISLKRAENVAAALVKAGAPKNSVAVEALSDSRPLFSESMPSGERMNRRAEIYVSY